MYDGPTTDAGNSLTASAPAVERCRHLGRRERAGQRQPTPGEHRVEQLTVEVRSDEELGAGVERRVELLAVADRPRPHDHAGGQQVAHPPQRLRGARNGERELDRAHPSGGERLRGAHGGLAVGRSQDGDDARGA